MSNILQYDFKKHCEYARVLDSNGNQITSSSNSLNTNSDILTFPTHNQVISSSESWPLAFTSNTIDVQYCSNVDIFGVRSGGGNDSDILIQVSPNTMTWVNSSHSISTTANSDFYGSFTLGSRYLRLFNKDNAIPTISAFAMGKM